MCLVNAYWSLQIQQNNTICNQRNWKFKRAQCLFVKSRQKVWNIRGLLMKENIEEYIS